MIFGKNNASKFPELISFEYKLSRKWNEYVLDHFFPFIFGDERNEMKKKIKSRKKKKQNKTPTYK